MGKAQKDLGIRAAIASGLADLNAFLEEEVLLIPYEQTRNELRRHTRTLLEKAKKPGEVLYIGIAGGTGVGKSTLINALARENISRASDRRPFTDRAVVYRHEDIPRGLDGVTHLVRETDAVHRSAAIRDLILLDLPDFDSVEEANRETVREIVPKLDSIVWVASPEKYADAKLYELINETRMHRDNFTFVLNKGDELAAGQTNDATGALGEMFGDFALRLKREALIEEPRIFIISASFERNGYPGEAAFLEEEFARLRQFLMARRDAKEITALKTSNLVEESRRLVDDVRMAVRVEEKREVLQAVANIDRQQGSPATDLADLWLPERQADLAAAIRPLITREDPSITPVRMALSLLNIEWLRGRGFSAETLDDSFNALASDVSDRVRKQCQAGVARIESELMLGLRAHNDLAAEVDERLEHAVGQVRAWFRHTLATADSWRKRWHGRLVRSWQRFLLLLPLLFLLINLAGVHRFEAWIQAPDWKGLAAMAVTILARLFSPEGLAGLAVLAVIETVLVFTMAARRRKRIETKARLLARSCVQSLITQSAAAAAEVAESRRRGIDRIRSGLERLVHLERSFAEQHHS